MAPLLPSTNSLSLTSALFHFLHASSIWPSIAVSSSASQLVRSTLTSAVDPAVLPLISNGTCYQASNMELSDHYIPCGNVQFGDHACCQAGDVCLESSACYNDALKLTYIAGCTDEAYANTTVCPYKGPWEDSAAWLGVAYVGSDTWAPCPPGDSPQSHLQEGTAVTCDSNKEVSNSAVFKAQESLKAIGILPPSLFDLIATSTSAPRDAPAPTDSVIMQVDDDDSKSVTSKDGDYNGETPFHGNPDILATLLLLTFFLFVLPVGTMFWRMFFIVKSYGTPIQRDLRRRGPVRASMDPSRHFTRPPAPPRRFSLYSLGSIGSMASLDDTAPNVPPEECDLSDPARPRNVRFADDVESGPTNRSPTQASMPGASSGSYPSTTKKLVKSETSKTFAWKGLCRKPDGTTASLPV